MKSAGGGPPATALRGGSQVERSGAVRENGLHPENGWRATRVAGPPGGSGPVAGLSRCARAR